MSVWPTELQWSLSGANLRGWGSSRCWGPTYNITCCCKNQKIILGPYNSGPQAQHWLALYKSGLVPSHSRSYSISQTSVLVGSHVGLQAPDKLRHWCLAGTSSEDSTLDSGLCRRPGTSAPRLHRRGLSSAVHPRSISYVLGGHTNAYFLLGSALPMRPHAFITLLS